MAVEIPLGLRVVRDYLLQRTNFSCHKRKKNNSFTVIILTSNKCYMISP